MVGGDRYECLHSLPAIDRDVRPTSRRDLYVSLDDRRSQLDRDLLQGGGPGSPTPKRHLTLGGAHVAYPIALAEHRDQVPLAVDVRHAQREASQLPALAAGHLERDPAAR